MPGARAEALAAVGVNNIYRRLGDGKRGIALVLRKLQRTGYAHLGLVAANAGHGPSIAECARGVTGYEDGPAEPVVERIFDFDIVDIGIGPSNGLHRAARKHLAPIGRSKQQGLCTKAKSQ